MEGQAVFNDTMQIYSQYHNILKAIKKTFNIPTITKCNSHLAVGRKW